MMSYYSQDCTTFAEATTPCYSYSTISRFTAKPSIVNAPLLIFLEYAVQGENSVLLRNSFHPHHFSKGHIVFKVLVLPPVCVHMYVQQCSMCVCVCAPATGCGTGEQDVDDEAFCVLKMRAVKSLHINKHTTESSIPSGYRQRTTRTDVLHSSIKKNKKKRKHHLAK